MREIAAGRAQQERSSAEREGFYTVGTVSSGSASVSQRRIEFRESAPATCAEAGSQLVAHDTALWKELSVPGESEKTAHAW